MKTNIYFSVKLSLQGITGYFVVVVVVVIVVIVCARVHVLMNQNQ